MRDDDATSKQSFDSPGLLSADRPRIEKILPVVRPAGPPLFLSRFRHDRTNMGLIEPVPLAGQIMVAVEFLPLGPTDVFRDGRHVRKPGCRPGTLALYDLRESWAADLRDPFDNLAFYLPLTSFEDYAAERQQTFLGVQFDIRELCYDQVILNLARAVLPTLESPSGMSTLYLHHVFLAARDHVAATYGRFSGRQVGDSRGLPRHQIRNALEYIEANLSKDVSLEDIARACSASVSSLTRGFKTALGASPHQWVLKRRIALAQRLMTRSNKTLSEIALLCGFSDQSHLSRVFMQHVRASPTSWRRTIQR